MLYSIRPIFLLSLLLMSGCQTIDVRGQFVSDQAINEINSVKPNQSDLINIIGTPTYVPDYSSDTWYYIQRSLAKRAWFDPKIIEQRIVKVTFLNNRVLDAVLLDNVQNDQVVANASFTPAYGTEQSGVQKFVKNIGRFNKTTDGASKRKKK